MAAPWAFITAALAGFFHGAVLAGRHLPANSGSPVAARAATAGKFLGKFKSRPRAGANFKEMACVIFCGFVGAAVWNAIAYGMTCMYNLHYEYFGLVATPLFFACLHYTTGLRRGNLLHSEEYRAAALDFQMDYLVVVMSIFLAICVSVARHLTPVIHKAIGV